MKPASDIHSWKDWPKDVVQTLRSWNHATVMFLSFRGTEPFTCADCREDCAGNLHGAAVQMGHQLCDDCLIARARRGRVVQRLEPSMTQRGMMGRRP